MRDKIAVHFMIGFATSQMILRTTPVLYATTCAFVSLYTCAGDGGNFMFVMTKKLERGSDIFASKKPLSLSVKS